MTKINIPIQRVDPSAGMVTNNLSAPNIDANIIR